MRKEKLNLVKSFIQFSLIFGLFLTSFDSQSQLLGRRFYSGNEVELNEFEWANPREYTIQGITISGSEYYDGNSMINISGLRVGDKIKLPGESLGGAIRKIMNQGILEDVKIYATKKAGSDIWLEIRLKERPRLYTLTYKGIRKGEGETISDKIKTYKGKIITETLKKNVSLAVARHFQEKGFLNVQVNPVVEVDSNMGNNARMVMNIEKGIKVKIKNLVVRGTNSKKLTKTVRRKLKNTKERMPGRFYKTSKFVDKKWEEDKGTLLDAMNKLGYRNFQVLKDSIVKLDDKTIDLYLDVFQGNKFYYRSINFEGNFIYPDSTLREVLGIQKGDVYNTEELSKRLEGNPGDDLSSVYMDNGYLFYNATPIEARIEKDSIDLVIRISEGKQATINRIILNGNTKTSDKVVLREIRTLPGQKFNKSLIIRTVRELSQIGYFDPEKIDPKPQPQPDGTVDIVYNVVEKSSDQIELSGGWGGYIGFIGTLGVTFNNFSLRSLMDIKNLKGIPSGDGQKLSVRFQANGKSFQNYSLVFTEPWFGGKKPNSFSVSFNQSISYPYQFARNQALTNPYGGYGYGGGLGGFGGGLGGYGLGGFGGGLGGFGGIGGFGGVPSVPDSLLNAHFNTSTISISLGKRLRWPDDYFSLSNSLSFTRYDVLRYLTFAFPEGISNTVAFVSNFSRNSLDNPTFTRSGSSFSLTASITPPFSLWGLGGKNKFIEYHKWMFDASWFSPLAGKFVIHTRAHLGFLGSYGNNPVTTFERFDLGGSGMVQGFTFNRDIIGLRGYDDRSIGPSGNYGLGGVAYNKFVLEVRYPISLNPSATIFGLAFAEGGNNFDNIKDYNPFKLYRTAGIGARVFMPAFGLIGIDYGFGFDKPRPGQSGFGRQAFTFSLGQQIR